MKKLFFCIFLFGIFISLISATNDTNPTNVSNVNNNLTSSICGNGILEGEEECDDGRLNSNSSCTSSYGTNCTYCDTYCKSQISLGGYCGDGACDNDEEVGEEINYATSKNFYGFLSWTETEWISADFPEKCSNGANSGDINLELGFNQISHMGDYYCESELVIGEHLELNNANPPRHFGLSNGGNYLWDGRIASSQYLKERHAIEICCYPLEDSTKIICKTFTLEPYC